MSSEQVQVISRERVAAYGEVYTAKREVNAMLNLVKTEAERVDSRFLEPACGRGIFLTEILSRKLIAAEKSSAVPRSKKIIPYECEKQFVIAISSIYGVDILHDNIAECRKNLFEVWDRKYTKDCGSYANDECREAVRFIIKRNIVCGNALSLMKVDDQGYDTDEPIIFSEWAFITGSKMQRRDFRFDRLLANEHIKRSLRKYRATETTNKELENPESGKDGDAEGELLTTYITHYRKIHKNDK